ncbi:MAG TPA: ROK family transcriptional regulator [Candidatus Brachybacterium merdigallinarum]|nr:ROK family transcriptional regulator [Candidatus Brachybacterium merdigallinarum]
MERQWSVREQHRENVLALLRRGNRLTRGEIAEGLNLTRSTVSDVLGGLLDQGVITVTEQRAPGGRGRPAEVLGIHPGAVRYIGLDFSHVGVTICLANSNGDVVASAREQYPHGAGWEVRVRLALRTIRELAVGEVHLDFLAGIGIGLPGPNSASWHGFVSSSPLEPFQMVRARIRELFAESFACPVVVDHHIRFAALYEATTAGDEHGSIVYLRLSTGVGGAVLGEGTALRGSHLLAGEIGHMIVDDSPDAQACRCGRNGCLETVASLGAVTRQWQKVVGTDGDLAHLREALESGDPRALELVTSVATSVGRVLGVATLVIDPAEVVIAGEIGSLLEPVMPVLERAIARQRLADGVLPVRSGGTAPEQGARGAIAYLRAADRPRPRHLPTSPRPHPAEGGPRVR